MTVRISSSIEWKASPEESEFSVLRAHSHLKATYRDAVLISHCDQLEAIDDLSTASLVISTDWLAWKKLIDQGRHVIHFETLLSDWPDQLFEPFGVYLRAQNWIFDETGQDVSEVMGVSLGRQFTAEVALFTKAVERLCFGLTRIVEAFKIEKLRILDVQTENRLLDARLKQLVLETALAPLDVELDFSSMGSQHDENLWPDRAYQSSVNHSAALRGIARKLYSVVIDRVCRVAHLRFGPRRTVLILNNWQVVEPLLRAFDSRKLAPVLIAGQWPKSPGFIWMCLRKGVYLADLPRAKLTADESAWADRLPGKFREIWQNHASSDFMETLRRDFVSSRVLHTDVFGPRLRLIKSYHKLFKRHRFSFTLVGDAGNALNRIVLALSRASGAQSAELANGMLLTDQCLDVRSETSAGEPLVDWFFAWGPQQEAWAKATKYQANVEVTGYPGIDRVRAGRRGNNQLESGSGYKRILVLGCWVDGYDTGALHFIKPAYTIEIISRLIAAGYDQVRLKLHPGTPNLGYYDSAIAYLGLAVEVFKSSPLKEHIAWADAIVGPVSSGSFVESLASGKPYFPVSQKPTLMAAAYTKRFGAFDSPEAVVAAIKSGDGGYRSDVLNFLCRYHAERNAATRAWAAVERIVSGPE
jgi:hypothetical protein